MPMSWIGAAVCFDKLSIRNFFDVISAYAFPDLLILSLSKDA